MFHNFEQRISEVNCESLGSQFCSLWSLVCLYTVCACILPIHTGSQSRVISSKGSSDVAMIWISALQTHFAMLLDSGPFPSLIEVSLMSNYIMNFMGLITIKRRSWGKKQLTVQAGILPCGSVRFWSALQRNRWVDGWAFFPGVILTCLDFIRSMHPFSSVLSHAF